MENRGTGGWLRSAVIAAFGIVFVLFPRTGTGQPAEQAGKTMPTLVTGSRELLLVPGTHMREGAWRINNWKEKQTVSLAFPEEKTPTGQPVVQLNFETDGGGCNVIAPEPAGGGDWRGKHYGSVSFWLKGDAKGQKAQFWVATESGNYSFSFRVDAPEWQKIVLPINAAFTRKGNKSDLNTASMFGFNSGKAISFMVGVLRMRTQAQELAVDVSPSVIVPHLPGAAIALDGTIDDAAWEQAHRIPELKLIKTGATPTEATDVRVFATDDTLYVGARMTDADTSKMRTQQTGRDVGVYQDDCFEVFVDHNLDAKTYRHFTLNAVGAIDDYRHYYDPVAEAFTYERTWNPDWQHKGSLTKTCWTVEVAIPFETAGIAIGKPFGLQVGRENHEIKEYSALTVTHRFPQACNFALAVIGTGTATLGDLSLAMDSPGDMCIEGRITPPGALELGLAIADPYGMVQNQTVTVQSDAAGQVCVPFKLTAPSEGRYRVACSGKVGDAPLKPVSVGFSLALPPDIVFGDIFLNPRPKELDLKPDTSFAFDKETIVWVPEGATERTVKTARFLRNELFKQTGLLLALHEGGAAPDKAFKVGLRGDILAPEALSSKLEALPAEGYVVDVTANGATLAGADERGTYYACVTLLQLFRARLLKKHEPVIPGAAIVDWPDRANRIIVHWPNGRWRSKDPVYPISVLKDWLRDTVAGSKYNYWSVDLGSLMEFDREAIVTQPKYGFYTRDQVAELVRFCGEHFIEFVPSLQSGGHSSHLVLPYPELQEPGYDHDQANVLHEKFYDVLFSIYEDILDVAPDAKYFHIWHDEWWHHPKASVTDTLQGKPRWQVYRDDILRNHAFFKERGIRMMMWGDFLSKRHNGGHPFFVHQAMDDLPRDIIITNWSARSFAGSTKDFVDAGFEVWDVFNQFGPAPAQDIPIIKGFGTISYAHFLQTFSYQRDDIPPGYAHAILRAADYGWNMDHDPQYQLGEWRRRYLNCVNALYTIPDRRTTALAFRPIDLSPHATLSTSEWFDTPKEAPVLPRGETPISFVPMQIAPVDSPDAVAPSPEQREVFIPINGKPKSLFFLQACHVAKDDLPALKKRGAKFIYGIPVGEVQILYEDAPTEIIELRMGINTLHTNPHPTARILYGTRYTLDVPTASGGRASTYLLEWANPPTRRRTTMRGILWKRYDTEATPVLFGLTVGE